MDLICIQALLPGGCDVLYIQCKTNGKISALEKSELINHSVMYGARPILAYKDKKGHIVISVLT
jgi:hypothetical protein